MTFVKLSHSRTELPPRARRILQRPYRYHVQPGTTSACAENTAKDATERLAERNYLRVRGEYVITVTPDNSSVELPPRARRILEALKSGFSAIGTTSACAENTRHGIGESAAARNYLRVRGEYATGNPPTGMQLELPPRARRIPQLVITPTGTQGTTSACAENTGKGRQPSGRRRNYLRVRGEYRRFIGYLDADVELPPRARRIRLIPHGITAFYGTTSACAENTSGRYQLAERCRNYLRVRGEYLAGEFIIAA